MSDILLMLLSAMGAVAGAAVILAGIGAVGGVLVTAIGAVGSVAIDMVPAGVCLGGAAYAASRTGYGGLE